MLHTIHHHSPFCNTQVHDTTQLFTCAHTVDCSRSCAHTVDCSRSCAHTVDCSRFVDEHYTSSTVLLLDV